MMKVITVTPHPDDSEFGLGGILSLARGAGHEIITLCNEKFDEISLDEKENVEKRKQEMLLVSQKTNSICQFFSIDDEIDNITNMIRKERPEIVFVPYFDDFNFIHVITTELVRKAIYYAQHTYKETCGYCVPQIFYYETYSSKHFEPEFIINVTTVFAQARQNLKLHKEGIQTLPSLEYKFQIQHQLRGIQGSCHYGEGIKIEREYWFSWCQNQKIGFQFLNSLM